MIKNILMILSSDLIAKGLGFIFVLLLAKLLTVEQFGIYNYLITTLALFSIIIQPIAQVYLRDFKFFEYKAYNVFYNIIPIVLFIPMGLILNNILKLEYPILLFIFFIYQLILINLQTLLNAKEHYKQFSLINIISQFSNLIVILYFYIFYNIDSIGLEKLIIIIYSASSVVLVMYILRIKNDFILLIDYKVIKGFFKDSSYLIAYWSLLPLIGFLDLFYAEKYLGNHDLGLYAFSQKIFAIALIGLSPIQTVLRIKQIDIVKEKNIMFFIKSNFRKVLFIGLLFYLLMIVFTYIVTFYFFEEYKKSFNISIILVTIAFISYITVPFNFLQAARKYKEVFYIGLISIVLNLIIKELFIDLYGIYAIVWSTFITFCFINISFFICSIYYFGTKKLEKNS